ncbi:MULTISPECIES: GNAT family N-acetyltransferase [Aerococcus]|uniref:GNAT family N-acetyltransferase n=1 Tax=Aerococcus loyolae TaxID=2976809 RepID=A0ABT4BXJ8_9LACT|nr:MULTISPECIES: GNAT family N-acetyltransferase [Aerococcus]MCY3024977.1 GNAT family N-acetyltransferase [Aerococcus loyolae]MCY3028551.1 GNAT family N-acetyltransferase [Aerococcus loyolae]MDK6231575.1 GNAT family N-acetyltransferase [Aerococcus urinae]MDK6257573.1 GNAT family N-acetyltransferase [Aerococcus urinae]MDK6293926.1 GNAT family N-acetyltransferase [Aerococcus urinae]
MVEIRQMEGKDVNQVWKLMKDLAEFEGYIDSFVMTPELVQDQILVQGIAQCLVADRTGEIVGILVYFYQDYTAQNQPYMHMKELIVKEGCQGERIGTRLMEEAKAIARTKNCWSIKWTVADWNDKAKNFYQQQGAQEDRTWLNYAINLEDDSE